MRRSTVLIADDHAIVRDGLVSLLQQHEFEIAGAVGTGDLLIERARALRPDVIVTDLSMPGVTGLDALTRLTAERLPSRVIVLTMHQDADLAALAMRSGASGYLLKESAGDELITAIRQVLQGRMYLAPALTKGIMERLARPAAPPQLTPRQRDVLVLIVKGQRMKEIAANLGLSTRTVESHKYEMMDALGLHSTAELVRYALASGLIVD